MKSRANRRGEDCATRQRSEISIALVWVSTVGEECCIGTLKQCIKNRASESMWVDKKGATEQGDGGWVVQLMLGAGGQGEL